MNINYSSTQNVNKHPLKNSTRHGRLRVTDDESLVRILSFSARVGAFFVVVEVLTEVPVGGREAGHGSHEDAERDAWVIWRGSTC